MSAAASAARHSSPEIPQPPARPEELRAALARLAPGSLPTFDAERADAVKAARERVSAAPLRRFCERWAIHIAIERYPEQAARMRELEARAGETDDITEARAIAAEIGRILDTAFAEANIERALGRD